MLHRAPPMQGGKPGGALMGMRPQSLSSYAPSEPTGAASQHYHPGASASQWAAGESQDSSWSAGTISSGEQGQHVDQDSWEAYYPDGGQWEYAAAGWQNYNVADPTSSQGASGAKGVLPSPWKGKQGPQSSGAKGVLPTPPEDKGAAAGAKILLPPHGASSIVKWAYQRSPTPNLPPTRNT